MKIQEIKETCILLSVIQYELISYHVVLFSCFLEVEYGIYGYIHTSSSHKIFS